MPRSNRIQFRRVRTLCAFGGKVWHTINHEIPKNFNKFVVVDWLNYYNGNLTQRNVDRMEDMAYDNPDKLLFIIFRDNPHKNTYRTFWRVTRQMSNNRNVVLCPVSAIPFSGLEKSRDDQAVMLLYRVLCNEFGSQYVEYWSGDQYRDAEEKLSGRCPPYHFAIMWAGKIRMSASVHPTEVNGVYPCKCAECNYYW